MPPMAPNPMMNALASLKGGAPQGGGMPPMSLPPDIAENPMTSNQEGTEVFVDKIMFPGAANLQIGDQVTLTGTVTVTGSKVGIQISQAEVGGSVEGGEDFGGSAEEAGSTEDSGSL